MLFKVNTMFGPIVPPGWGKVLGPKNHLTTARGCPLAMTDSQAWLTLLVAIAAEIAGTSLLKLSEGLTRPWPTVLLLLAYGCAIALVAKVVMVIPLGITYALWSGIGTLAVVLVGALAYRQFLSTSQMMGVALIAAGVVIVNLGGDAHP